ncbi:DUF4276 family protein [Streptosporangium algeriense]|uniref:DUF4276 family protein n=1 Tax=Streptosporangium algeriense TaxID=1682748 RepID=A0ABW3DQV7_9ACTN
MRHICVLVEGQTEEIVVRDVLGPEFGDDVWLTPVILKTSRPAGNTAGKGGVSAWRKIERDLRLLLRNPAYHRVTTLIDYYGLPGDAPGMDDIPAGTPHTRVEHVERAIHRALDDNPRFIPNLVLHETETWVFAAAKELGELLGRPDVADALRKQAERAGGPELVNGGKETAPSKRVLATYPGYRKTHDGPLAIAAYGLTALRRDCPRLDAWVVRLLGDDRAV